MRCSALPWHSLARLQFPRGALAPHRLAPDRGWNLIIGPSFSRVPFRPLGRGFRVASCNCGVSWRSRLFVVHTACALRQSIMAVHGSWQSRKRQLQFILSLVMLVAWWPVLPNTCWSSLFLVTIVAIPRSLSITDTPHAVHPVVHQKPQDCHSPHLLVLVATCQLRCRFPAIPDPPRAGHRDHLEMRAGFNNIKARCISFPEGCCGASPYHLLNA